ncbi:MAG: hypothetical protein HRT40_12460 [Campylobacteraceae bacterium]|nr:hypothetical protein [Campylobacteraceae bacterium]
MIKKIKRKYYEYQVNKIIDITHYITEDIAIYKFDEAFNSYKKLLLNYKRFNLENKIEVNIIKLHLLFAFKDYDKFINESKIVINLINSKERYKIEYKQYFKGFIYNLKMIVFLINGELEKANLEKNNVLGELDIKMSDKEFELLEYTYPIYDENKIKDFFKQNKYYENVSLKKKELVINYLKNITEEIKDEVLIMEIKSVKEQLVPSQIKNNLKIIQEQFISLNDIESSEKVYLLTSKLISNDEKDREEALFSIIALKSPKLWDYSDDMFIDDYTNNTWYSFINKTIDLTKEYIMEKRYIYSLYLKIDKLSNDDKFTMSLKKNINQLYHSNNIAREKAKNNLLNLKSEKPELTILINEIKNTI